MPLDCGGGGSGEGSQSNGELDELFDQDYLDFYERELRDDVSDDEAELIGMLACIEAGERVLDAPCGHGRIAERLARMGADVVGIDRSELFLERARASAKRRGVAVDYRHCDLRELPFVDEFDVAVTWFTSFGYDRDDDALRHVLWRLQRSLRPGGRLLIETLNVHEPGLTDYETDAVKEVRDEQGTHLLIDRTRFDPHDARLHVRRLLQRPGRPLRELSYTLRLFTFSELRSWLLDAGFAHVQAFGADAEMLRVDSRRMILVASKEH
ncbi:MAG: class I SAM-dependent methyltransferase [Planctomycetota bacterium]